MAAPQSHQPLTVAGLRRRAFTLVELLVVIGIIALLISILLPSLGRAQEQGKELKCLNNLRQIVQATIMYCQNAKDIPPDAAEGPPQNLCDWIYWQPPGFTPPYDDVTQGTIAPYISRNADVLKQIMRCPSDSIDDHVSNYGGRPPIFYSYSMNCFISGNS